MRLYHGSYIAIEKPDLSMSRRRTDFGQGFYLTPMQAQAADWSRRFIREHGSAVVSAYEFLPGCNDRLPKNMKILEFDSHSLEWMNFITACRLGKPIDTKWDLVIGGVANDKIFNTLELYFRGELSAREAIRRLHYNKPNFQYCFKNQALIDEYLHFRNAEAMA
jgi:hypothetical protein